eukprot:scaffold1052_cov339-Pavlova_lutheri.AAC.44
MIQGIWGDPSGESPGSPRFRLWTDSRNGCGRNPSMDPRWYKNGGSFVLLQWRRTSARAGGACRGRCAEERVNNFGKGHRHTWMPTL